MTEGATRCAEQERVLAKSEMDTAEEIYQRLIAPIEGKMIAIVSRIVGPRDEAADVFQEALAVVWQKLARIDRQPNPHAYIMRICINLSYDALRRRGRQQREMLALRDLARRQAESRPKPPSGPEALEGLYNAIRSLPRQQAEAVLLRLVDETPYPAIGDILNCSEATARSHVSKGRLRLREMLSGQESSQ
jgi:RNA polymerase sigma factor (sigma-70 family)